ncbi:MAG TPA: DUF4304 domain-containing protein [Planctomycetaceae bacterium]|jgi:hypothetical protein
MGGMQSPSRKRLNEVVAQAAVPVLKRAGFRKTALNFDRRHGEAVQVINFQTSHGPDSAATTFYINVGIAFDAVCVLTGCQVIENPKEHECDARGTRDRIQGLISGAPDCWTVRDGDAIGECVNSVRDFVGRVLLELNQIDGIAAYRSHFWFDRFRPKGENAQILFLLGDQAGALEEVRSLAALFSDRKNADSAEWWIKMLHLGNLAR